MTSWEDLESEFETRIRGAREMGGADRIARERAKGKYTARERIEKLCDANSFDEWGTLAHHQESSPDMVDRATPSDGLVCGVARINGRTVVVAADDATVMGGSRGIIAEEKLSHLRKLAISGGYPFIALQEASGGRLQELMGASFSARTFSDNFRDLHMHMSGWVPTVSALMGSCFGQPAFVSALADCTFMVQGAAVGASGPPVVKAAIGENSTETELGGSVIAEATGLVDKTLPDEDSLFEAIRTYLARFPDNSAAFPPVASTTDPADRRTPQLRTVVPTNLRRAYDMSKVIGHIIDADSEFLELGAGRGSSMITGLAALGGQSVGIIASQPLRQAGVIDAAGAEKAARFIQLLDAYHIPLVFLVDTPGFMVGKKAESQGLAGAAGGVLAAIFASSVPRITVILRKSYGLAYFAMNGRCMSPSMLYAWPTASISQMGPEAAVAVLHSKDLAGAEDPEALRRTRIAEFEDKVNRPYDAAGWAAVDEVIMPDDTRARLIQALRQQRASVPAEYKHRVPTR